MARVVAAAAWEDWAATGAAGDWLAGMEGEETAAAAEAHGVEAVVGRDCPRVRLVEVWVVRVAGAEVSRRASAIEHNVTVGLVSYVGR